jgi:hypothetical protein
MTPEGEDLTPGWGSSGGGVSREGQEGRRPSSLGKNQPARKTPRQRAATEATAPIAPHAAIAALVLARWCR